MKPSLTKIILFLSIICFIASGVAVGDSRHTSCQQGPNEEEYQTYAIKGPVDSTTCNDNNYIRNWSDRKGWEWNSDRDGDGIKNNTEVIEGLDPLTPNEGDTDNDGFSDEFEAIHPQLDPLSKDNPEELDVNNNGINDQVEFSYGVRDFTREFDGEDSDGDGLTDEYEEIVGTNPNKADTDSDGYDDKVELARPGPLPELNPLYKDLVIELDSMDSTELIGQYNAMPEYTQKVQIENPNGETGFKTHIIKDDIGEISYKEDLEMTKVSSNPHKFIKQDYEKYGAVYTLVVYEVKHKETYYNGYALYNSDTIYLSAYQSSHRVLLHELGHIMGLTDKVHRYIDSDDANVSEYPSIMNYSVLENWTPENSKLRFSDGSEGEKDYNDREVIQTWFSNRDYEINDKYTDNLEQEK